LEYNWEIIELIEEDLSYLKVEDPKKREEVIQHVGLKILSLLLSAVK
jgi:hypothetical protein